MSYKLKVRVAIDDTYDAVHNLFKYHNVTTEFWHSFIPPNHMVYWLGPLSTQGIENWKAKLDATACKYTADVFDERA